MRAETLTCCSHFTQCSSFHLLQQVKQQLQSTQKVLLGDIPALEKELPFREKGEQIFQTLTTQQKSQDQSQLSISSLWWSILSCFQSEILCCFVLVQLEMLCKVGLAFLLRELFYSIKDNDHSAKYIFTGLVVLTLCLHLIFSENGWKMVGTLAVHLKGSLTVALHRKVVNLKTINIKANTLGAISDAVTQLHDILENQGKFILAGLAAPLAIVGLSVFLVTNVGWFSLIGISLTLLFQLLHFLYASYNSTFLHQALRLKDKRMELLFQIISSFRYIKMQLWQDLICRKLLDIRRGEKQNFVKYGAGLSLQISLSHGVSTASMLIILGLTVKFTSDIASIDIILLVLGITQMKLITIFSSLGISCFYQVKIGLSKIVAILLIPTQPAMVCLNDDQHQLQLLMMNSRDRDLPIIVMEDISLPETSSPFPNQYSLFNVNVQIFKGELVGVCGQSEGKKSVFLKCLAQQVPFYEGHLQIQEQVCLAENIPVIFSETIRDNILFGRQMNKELYNKVIRLSCLEDDLQILAKGDLTLIEEGGVNLSGGQKTRISLARCLYADRPILLLDDPLSSVDAIVAKQMMLNFSELVSEGKTVILVSHQISYFNRVQRILLVEDHEIRQINDFEKKELLMHESEISDISMLLSPQNLEALLALGEKTENQYSIIQERKDHCPEGEVVFEQDSAISWGFWKSFLSYIFVSKWNYLFFSLTVLFYISSETLYALIILLLNQYDSIRTGGTSTVGGSTTYWIVLSCMSLLVFILQLFRTFFLNLSIQQANKTLHKNALKKYLSLSVLQADHLKGQYILGRFSTDLGLLDIGLLPEISTYFIVFSLAIIQTIFISIYNPIILIFSAAITIPVYLWNQYSCTIVNILKKLDLQLKAPILSIFRETVKGLMQIDILEAKQYRTNVFLAKLMNSMIASLAYRRVFRVYISYSVYFSALVVCGAYFGLVSPANSDNIHDFTFAAVFLIEISNALSSVFSNSVKITSILSSAERLQAFNEMRSEEAPETPEQGTNDPQANLVETERGFKMEKQESPSGSQKQLQSSEQSLALSIDHATIRFVKEREAALANFSLDVARGEKVGLIGRTGSGKSTVIQLLYRLVQPQQGSAYQIEGKDALTMALSDLRGKFACIPQTPFVFSGTLRENLDPFQQCDSEQIIQTLQAVTVWPKLQKMEVGLDSDLGPFLGLLKVDEKQLLCLARAMLQNKEYLILDEATSNLDLETDALVQQLIREKFGGKTIIAVAHRLQTIADFDRIVVLSGGRVVEAGSPPELYRKRGEFYSMVNSTKMTKRLVLQSMNTK